MTDANQNVNPQDVDGDLLDDDLLDDLADLPTSAPFPSGAHLCDMVIKRNPDQKKKKSYIVEFTHKSTMELVNPNATAPKPGDKAAMFLHTLKKDGTKNEFGEGQLKMILTPLAERLQLKSISALIDATHSGIEVAIVSGVKKQEGYQDQMVLNKLILS